ncbi:MAG TPA: ComEC/Rec2 family competence protein, partial [Gemmatimonadales bacterium]|nr:ComEC/Rec2 family competence protein [Gemmatimonadales bacterium]
MTGLSRFLDPAVALVLITTMAAGLRRHPVGLLPVAFGAGLLMALTAHVREAGRCPARLSPGAVQLTIRLADPVSGGTARARVEDHGCHGLVAVRLEQADSMAAGTRLAITGRWLPRQSRLRPAGGTLIVRSHEAVGSRPRVAERVRTAVTRASESLYGDRAPIVDALILGRRTAMDPELREDFARAGLVHLLAISGFHVGLLTSW